MSEDDAVRMSDLVNGKDYLVDYYALFEVDPAALRDADRAAAEALLRAAYQLLNRQYHPDRYNHLSPALKDQAEHVHRAVTDGHAVLTDPVRRAAYDAQLAAWTGPVSSSGFPVYDFGFQRSKNHTVNDATVAAAKQFLSGHFGYNPSTHSMLERLVVDEKSKDPELREAFDRSLAARDLLLASEEQLRWEQAGLGDRPIVENAPAGYLEDVREELAEARVRVLERAPQLLLEAQSGRLLLTSADGQDRTQEAIDDPESALVRIQDSLLRPVDDVAPHLERLAKDRAAAFEQRIALSVEYRPRQKKLRPRLALCIEAPGRNTWNAFRLQGTAIIPDDASQEDLAALADPDVARLWIRRGWNVMFVRMRDDLGIREQFTAALTRHFEAYLAESEPKNAPD